MKRDGMAEPQRRVEFDLEGVPYIYIYTVYTGVPGSWKGGVT